MLKVGFRRVASLPRLAFQHCAGVRGAAQKCIPSVGSEKQFWSVIHGTWCDQHFRVCRDCAHMGPLDGQWFQESLTGLKKRDPRFGIVPSIFVRGASICDLGVSFWKPEILVAQSLPQTSFRSNHSGTKSSQLKSRSSALTA